MVQQKTTGIDGTHQPFNQDGCTFKTFSAQNALQRDKMFVFHHCYKTISHAGETIKDIWLSINASTDTAVVKEVN